MRLALSEGYTKMVHITALRLALTRAMDEAPGSIRALAREAGVPHSSLVRIRLGRIGVTRSVASAVADALEHWSARCTDCARELRSALGD